MDIRSPRTLRAGAYVGLFAAVAAVGFWLVRPLQDGPAASDAAASVLFFDRIVAGRHLEVFVNTTPKPLLTVVLGGLHAISGAWWPGAVATVLAAALGIVLASELVRRIAGIEAALFAGVALVGLSTYQAETSWSYALPWAFLFWMAAGLQLVRPRPRYGIAGLMLLLAGLARPETFILLGLATLILGLRTIRGPRPERAAWLLMTGWLAVAGLCAHDLLLTGNPLWWTGIATHSVALNGGRARSLSGVVRMSASRLVALWPLVIAACVGGLRLLQLRSWVAAAGVIAMGPLVIVYTWCLAVVHVNVLTHYLHPIDLAIVLAAAVGVALILVETRRRVAKRYPRAGLHPAMAVTCAVAVVLAVVLSRPFVPLSASARASIALEATIASRLTSSEAILRGARPSDRAGSATDPGPMGAADPAAAIFFVPSHRLIRLAVDLGLPLTRIVGVDPARVDVARGYPPVGSIVYLDGIAEPASVGAQTLPLQVSQPTLIGGVLIVPILSNPDAREWIVRVAAGP